jgi:hypothetical protein
LKTLPNLVFSPFQWTSAISPQLIRGRAIAIGARSKLKFMVRTALVNAAATRWAQVWVQIVANLSIGRVADRVLCESKLALHRSMTHET